MRWLAVVIVLATASSASARMMRRRDPPVVEACRQEKSWPLVEACLDKLGSFTVDRATSRVRLVHVTIDNELAGRPPEDAGFYLYAQAADGSWQIGGMYARGGQDVYVRDLVEMSIGKVGLFRLDVGAVLRTQLTIDGSPALSTVVHTRSAVFCYGSDYRCREIQTDCEVMSRGKTLFSFHGTLRRENHEVFVEGDERNAGSVCRSGGSLVLVSIDEE